MNRKQKQFPENSNQIHSKKTRKPKSIKILHKFQHFNVENRKKVLNFKEKF